MEPGNLLFYNTKPAGVLSPRKQLDNNKLPSISRAKSPESSYAQRNMEHLKQLQEKRMKQQELIEKSRKKEEDEREKLKQLVLEEAARVREQKKQKEIVDKENLDAAEVERKENLAKLKEEEGKNKDEEPDKEKDDKTKLYHYYRSRHVSFLQSLKETQKSRKEKEEQEKKKKDETMNKLRENMGINNVTSKFYDFDKTKEKPEDKENNRDTVEEITAAYLGKSVKRIERPRSSDQKPLTADSQRILLDRQKKALIDIYQKKKDQIQAGEDKEKQLLKQRERLKEKVLTTMRKDEEDLNKKQRPVSLSLNSLDLENTFAKDKPQKSLLSLPAIKEKQTQENNENAHEKGDATKVKDAAKAQKNGQKKKSKKKLPTYPNITDMTLWKKRHRLDPETKVFSISGGYGDIKAALEKRGWIENPDINSPCFDLKWTLRGKDIEHGALLDGQIVNHFDKNTSITTKVGLCKNLRNLIWFNNVDIDTFYPRCFDLSDVHDYEDFIDEFKFCKAESILKQYVNACKNNDPKVKEMELKVQVAATICESKLVDPDELLEDQARLEQILVSPEEWEIISSDELTQKALALKKHEAWLAKYEITSGPKCAVGQKEKAKKKKKRKSKISKVNNNKQLDGKEGEGDGENEEENENELLDRVESILEEYKTKFPQFGLNGDKNIWIVKPAGLSRGRGISCFRNLVEIQDYVKGKESQWIAQKYMENPMIVHKRKFDIRQWVLVTDWNPLSVWYYEECYVRFSAEEYETENLDNKFVHLTNNSIGKYHENQNCSTFEQNMWRMENLIKYMQEQFGSNIFEEQIKPKMKQIVIWALECVQDMVENRKNSHEFYGFDFMIDEDFNVWLIEINSSPDMEYSTPVTKRLVQTVSDDIVKVVVDYNLCKDKKKRKEVDTGLFSLIHQSKRFVEKPLNSFGLDLFLEGKKVGK